MRTRRSLAVAASARGGSLTIRVVHLVVLVLVGALTVGGDHEVTARVEAQVVDGVHFVEPKCSRHCAASARIGIRDDRHHSVNPVAPLL